jgi:hypothetical protein
MRRFVPLPLLALVVACANGVQISREYIPQGGVPGHADFTAALGETPVVILNSPVPASDLLEALRSNDPRRHRFTAEPPPSADRGYRIVLMFDAMPSGPHGCRAPAQNVPSANAARADVTRSTTSVYGAFCLGPVLLSEAVATAPRLQSASDPLLRRLLGDLLTAIMPFRDPHETLIEDG